MSEHIFSLKKMKILNKYIITIYNFLNKHNFFIISNIMLSEINHSRQGASFSVGDAENYTQ